MRPGGVRRPPLRYNTRERRPAMPLLQAQEITYTDVQQLRKDRSIAFLSASALEVHGPHLPLGMDMFMARWMAEETARRFAEGHPDWTVVLYPHIPLGTDELPLPGSIDGTQQTVYRALLAHRQPPPRHRDVLALDRRALRDRRRRPPRAARVEPRPAADGEGARGAAARRACRPDGGGLRAGGAGGGG